MLFNSYYVNNPSSNFFPLFLLIHWGCACTRGKDLCQEYSSRFLLSSFGFPLSVLKGIPGLAWMQSNAVREQRNGWVLDQAIGLPLSMPTPASNPDQLPPRTVQGTPHQPPWDDLPTGEVFSCSSPVSCFPTPWSMRVCNPYRFFNLVSCNSSYP